MWVNQTPIQNEHFSKNGWILQFYTQNAHMKQLIDHVHWIRTLRTVTLYTHFGSSNNAQRNPEYKVYLWQVPSDLMDMLAWSLVWQVWIPWSRSLPKGPWPPNGQPINAHIWGKSVDACNISPSNSLHLGTWGLQNNIYLSGTLVLVSVVKRVWTEITRCALWRWPASHLQHWQSPHGLMTWKQLCWDWWLRCCFIGCPL